MAGRLMGPWWRALDANGNPISGAKAYFCATGTNNPQNTFTTNALTTARTNPVVSDAAGWFRSTPGGEKEIWADNGNIYRVWVTDAAGVIIYGPEDDITPVGAGAAVSGLSKTANYTVLIADLDRRIAATGPNSWSLSLPPGSTLPSGWRFRFANEGTGVITIVPNGVDMVDGTAGFTVPASTVLDFFWTGSAWFTDQVEGSGYPALAKSASYSLTSADRNKALNVTSTGTLSLLAAATAGDGFTFLFRNEGTGIWTIDPNGAELINGAATQATYPGQAFAVISNGTSWRTYSSSQSWTEIASAPSSSAVSFTSIPAAFGDLLVVLEGVQTGSAVGLTIAVGDATPTYSSAAVFGSAAIYHNGAVFIPAAQRDYGALFASESGDASVLASPAIQATAGTVPGVGWRVTGGIRSLRLYANGSIFLGGIIRLLGR